VTTVLRIGFAAIARPTFDVALAGELAEQSYQQLRDANLDMYGSSQLLMDGAAAEAAMAELRQQELDLLIVFQATFADSSMVVDLARQIEAPLLLWAAPEAGDGGRLRLNALCGINLAAHALTRAGRRYAYSYAQPGAPELIGTVEALACAGRARRALRHAQIGRVGEHPLGFETCVFDAAQLKRRFGVEVVQLELEQVFAGARAAPERELAPVRARVGAALDGLETLDATALDRTLSAYVALRQTARSQDLHGLAIRCWPEFFTNLNCAACGAMSLLTDERVPCSCEADVNGTVTQLLLQAMGDRPAFGADLVTVDAAEDVAVFWHCGLAPLAMADETVRPRGTIHSNRRLPLLMEFPLKPGRVTVARLSHATGDYRLVVGRGEMLRTPPRFTGTSGVLRFDRPAGEVLDIIMREGLEHHYTLIYGDYSESLLALADLLDLPVLRLTD
jgi:L-fucose isomerase-like protein